MTDAEEKELVAVVKQDELTSQYVHVLDQHARDKFLNGHVLFDVTPGGTRLNHFFKAHRDLEPFALKTKTNGWATKGQILITAHRDAYQRKCYQELLNAGLLPDQKST